MSSNAARRDPDKPTAQEAAVQDAYMEGQRAGHLAHERGQNPWPEGTPERDAWERGRLAVVGL